MYGQPEWVPSENPSVDDYTGNPFLRPQTGEWLIGDPTVLQIGDELHLWANEVFHGIMHYVAPMSDPFSFELLEESVILPGAVRGHAMINDGKVVLFYEQY